MQERQERRVKHERAYERACCRCSRVQKIAYDAVGAAASGLIGGFIGTEPILSFHSIPEASDLG